MARRPRRWRRVAITAIGLFVLVGGLAGLKFWQIATLMAVGDSMAKAGPPPEAVGTSVAEARSWDVTLSAVGTVNGIESVAVSNEVAGVVHRIRFDSGAIVQAGQVLVELDSAMEKAQLAAAKSRLELARVTVDRSRKLTSTGALARQVLDADEAAFASAEGEVGALQAQVDHKSIKAPFAGRAGIRAVNLGQYLAPGTSVTTLDSLGGVYVDFSLPQQELGRVAVGTTVDVAVGTSPPYHGTITAIDPTVDPATRSLRLRAVVRERHEELRPGMFVTVTVVLPKKAEVVLVPQTAIVHASYGDSIFVVEDKPANAPGMRTTPDGKPVKVARQQFVRTGAARGDFIAIDEGIKPGQTIVAYGAFKLRNGAPIVVDNRVHPEPKLDPHPENR
jgi:membrane fusion protein (multidrug efflux system)